MWAQQAAEDYERDQQRQHEGELRPPDLRIVVVRAIN